MTVRELCGIFALSSKSYEIVLYGNGHELVGTTSMYADARVLFVRDAAIKCNDAMKIGSGVWVSKGHTLILEVEIEV